MRIFAIDPGPKMCGWVDYDSRLRLVMNCGYDDRRSIRMRVSTCNPTPYLAIEGVDFHGQFYNRDLDGNSRCIGYFEAYAECHELPIHIITARQTRVAICHNAGFKVTQLRMALIDYFGGKSEAIGGKKCTKCKGKGWYGSGRPTCDKCDGTKWEYPPGPLYGLNEKHCEHIWSALAVAVAFAEQDKNKILKGVQTNGTKPE